MSWRSGARSRAVLPAEAHPSQNQRVRKRDDAATFHPTA